MKSLYFDDSDEPDSYRFEFMEYMKSILKQEGVTGIILDFDSKQDWYKTMNAAREFAENGIKVSCTSRENNYDVVLEEAEDMEEKN